MNRRWPVLVAASLLVLLGLSCQGCQTKQESTIPATKEMQSARERPDWPTEATTRTEPVVRPIGADLVDIVKHGLSNYFTEHRISQTGGHRFSMELPEVETGGEASPLTMVHAFEIRHGDDLPTATSMLHRDLESRAKSGKHKHILLLVGNHELPKTRESLARAQDLLTRRVPGPLPYRLITAVTAKEEDGTATLKLIHH